MHLYITAYTDSAGAVWAGPDVFAPSQDKALEALRVISPAGRWVSVLGRLIERGGVCAEQIKSMYFGTPN